MKTYEGMEVRLRAPAALCPCELSAGVPQTLRAQPVGLQTDLEEKGHLIDTACDCSVSGVRGGYATEVQVEMLRAVVSTSRKEMEKH
jgi:hypothetical protein